MICTIDTFNTQHMDASSRAMGTSETHSDKAVSDEEDYKLNIPYFEEANGTEMDYARASHSKQSTTLQSHTHSSTRNYDLLNRNHQTGATATVSITTSTSAPASASAAAAAAINADVDDDDDDDVDDDDREHGPNRLNYANWDNDDLYGDDKASRIGSDYSGKSTSESPNLFLTPGPPLYYGDPNAPDIKYPPDELLMQPPSRYNHLQFEMPQPQPQRRHLQPLPPPHLQHLHPALQHRHHHHPLHHPQYGGIVGDGGGGSNGSGAAAGAGVGLPYHTHHQQQQLGFQNHPNMWYPNAPYGASRYNYDPHRYPFQYNTSYGHDPMIDMLQLSNSGREARNRAEKNRRDKLNGSIQELSTMVPHVAESPRRVDKTAVLRFAAHGLRLKYVFGESLQQQRTQATDPLMRLLDSFFITLTCHGQIVLISSSIEQHLGHCQADLYGQNILHITHPEDHCMLKHQIIPTDLENLFDVQPEDDSGEPRPRTQAEEELIDKKLREDKRSFTVRLARAGPRSEPTAYEVVRIDGCFRRSDLAPRGVKNSPFPSSLQLIRRSRGRDDSIPLHTISGNDIVLIAIARIIRPPKIVNRIMESTALEYKTRHLIDGRIIDCDQRIGIVAGYMTDEVRNLSPFTFIHQDDVRWVIVALRQMYDCNSSYGESTYRLLSRNGNFIYLQSRGYLEIDKNSNKVHSFVCINTLLSEEEGKRRVEEMKRKFSIIINTQIPPSSNDAPASDNPQQLEKAVLRLIENLQKSSDDEENDYSCDSVLADGNVNAALETESHASSKTLTPSSSSSKMRSSKTPPLALVPPETDSVKSSISKSVNVVNVTSGRQLRESQRLKSPPSTTEEEDDNMELDTSNQLTTCKCQSPAYDYENNDLCEHCQRNRCSQRRSSDRGTKKHKLSTSQSSDDGCEMPRKRRTTETNLDVHSNSMDEIHQSFETEINEALFSHEHSSNVPETLENNLRQNETYQDLPNERQLQTQIHNRQYIDEDTTNKTSTNQTRLNDNDSKQR